MNVSYIKNLIVGCLFLSMVSVFAEVAVVINKANKDTTISKSNLKKIFLGKYKKWSDGKKVVIATLKSGDSHKSFLKEFLKKSPSQFKSFWKRLVFTGKAKMPKTFKTEKELLEYVAKTPGAIGYIDKKNIIDTVKKADVK